MVSGLSFIYDKGEVTRREFFLPSGRKGDASVKLTAALEKELNSKHWQREVLDRLIEHAVLQQTGSRSNVTYAVVNRSKLLELLRDHAEGGLRLSWFLFPGEVPEAAPEAPDLEDVLAEPDEPKPTIAMVVRAAQAENQGAVTDGEALIRLVDFMSALDEANSIAIRYLQAYGKNLLELKDEVAEIKGQGEKAIKEAATAARADAIINHNHLGGRIKALEKTQTELCQMVYAQQAVLKRAAGAMEKTAAIAPLVEEFKRVAEESESRTKALQQAVEVLVEELRKERKDKLTGIAARLNAHVAEADSLKEMILEAITDGTEKAQ